MKPGPIVPGRGSIAPGAPGGGIGGRIGPPPIIADCESSRLGALVEGTI